MYGGYPNQLFYTNKNFELMKFATTHQSKNSMMHVISPDGTTSSDPYQPARNHKSQGN